MHRGCSRVGPWTAKQRANHLHSTTSKAIPFHVSQRRTLSNADHKGQARSKPCPSLSAILPKVAFNDFLSLFLPRRKAFQVEAHSPGSHNNWIAAKQNQLAWCEQAVCSAITSMMPHWLCACEPCWKDAEHRILAFQDIARLVKFCQSIWYQYFLRKMLI